MKFSASEFKDALRQKKLETGEPSRPAKRIRRQRQTEPAPGVGASVTPGATNESAEELAGKTPGEDIIPEPAGTNVEEGEIAATTEASVVVVDLDEESPTAADEPGAGQAATAAKTLTAAKPEVEKTPPPVEAEPVIRKPEAGAKRAGAKRKGPESSPRRSAPPPAHTRAGRPQERSERPGPRLSTMVDAGQAARLLQRVPTTESVEEVRRMSLAATLDMTMVSMVQTINGVMGLREMMVQHAGALSKAIDRANRYKEESAAKSQSLARLHAESKAREEELKNQIKEAERRAEEASRKASSLEAEMGVASIRLKTVQARASEQDRQLQHAREQAAAAVEEARAAAGRAATAEKAAADAKLEKDGAVASGERANVRAEEAERLAKEAEAKAEKAVDDYKSSPEFRKEVIEASLDAYVKGFDSCKMRVSEVFKISSPELEKLRPEESDEEQSEEEGGAEPETKEP